MRANNMINQLPCKDALLQEFDDKWHQDEVVMDKWFILQAMAGQQQMLQTVRSLLSRSSFTLANPNALMRELNCLYEIIMITPHEDGSGYLLLTNSD